MSIAPDDLQRRTPLKSAVAGLAVGMAGLQPVVAAATKEPARGKPGGGQMLNRHSGNAL